MESEPQSCDFISRIECVQTRNISEKQKMCTFEAILNETSMNRSIRFFCVKYLLLLAFGLNYSAAYSTDPPQWWKDIHSYNPDKSWYEYMTYTSAFFGPNALPVPELYDGRVPMKHQAEVSTDVFWGFGDQTQSLSTRLVYTPIPGKLSISGWGVLAEHYRTSTTVRDERASQVEHPQETILIGDLYLSTLIGLLKEKAYQPDVNLEIVLKTSSSKSPVGARFMDTPGYWFNLTAGKSFYFQGSVINEMRFVGNLGFLCYQLNQVHQNDAPLYGGKVMLSSGNWTVESGIHGYSGWLNQGDKPLVLRGKLDYTSGSMHYFMQYQHALRDYPFHRLQTGVAFNF
jgi:hypothetical protein